MFLSSLARCPRLPDAPRLIGRDVTTEAGESPSGIHLHTTRVRRRLGRGVVHFYLLHQGFGEDRILNTPSYLDWPMWLSFDFVYRIYFEWRLYSLDILNDRTEVVFGAFRYLLFLNTGCYICVNSSWVVIELWKMIANGINSIYFADKNQE